MKRIPYILSAMLVLASCDNDFLETENVGELVVEGWIESGHAPVVLVSSTLPVSSTPQNVSSISEHILRYAEVYIDHGGVREYLASRLTDRFVVGNYFTSPSLRGVSGETYSLHVKWMDFEASAVCTIPEPVAIDTLFLEKAHNDTSYVAMMQFRNDPSAGRYYQSFCRFGDASKNYEAVNFTSFDGSIADTVITERFMKKMAKIGLQDLYLHPGDTISVKLAAVERSMFDFWGSFADSSNSYGTILSAPTNVKGNVTGAIGYWAGYGIDIREIVCP